MRIDRQRSTYIDPTDGATGHVIDTEYTYSHHAGEHVYTHTIEWSDGRTSRHTADELAQLPTRGTSGNCGTWDDVARAQLAAALPALTDASPAQHARAAARMVADMEAEGDIVRRPKIGGVY